VNASLISGLSGPQGIAISGSHIFVTNSRGGNVGEYNLDGTVVNPSLISGLDEPLGIAVEGTAVPEPSTYAAILGFVSMGFVVIRRRFVRSR
jgi:hypothetical protein